MVQSNGNTMILNDYSIHLDTIEMSRCAIITNDVLNVYKFSSEFSRDSLQVVVNVMAYWLHDYSVNNTKMPH